MAKTVYMLDDVYLDLMQADFGLYRGTHSSEFTLVQTIDMLPELRALAKRKKGVVSLSVACSAENGPNAPEEKVVFKGLRVLKVFRHSEQTCAIVLTDVSKELDNWICKRDLNVLYRDGYREGTRKPTVVEALPFLLEDAWHLFSDDALGEVDSDKKVPDDLLAAGASLKKPLDELLSRFGIDLSRRVDGKLAFARKDDITGSPIKGKYHWAVAGEPSWLHDVPTVFRKAKKLRYYYRRRHCMLAHVMHDRSTKPSGLLAVILEQCYRDDEGTKDAADEAAAQGSEYAPVALLSLKQLLAKYAPGVSANLIDDEFIGQVYMTENFARPGKEYLKRDGTADRDTLIRIIKRDWRLLYRVEFADKRMSLGGFTDLRVGAYRAIKKPTDAQVERGLKEGDLTGDVEPPGGVRGEWAEFLRILHDSGGPQSISGCHVIKNHLRGKGSAHEHGAKQGQAELPVAPFEASWEGDHQSGALRFRSEALRDGNTAVLAKVSNPNDMIIGRSKNPIINSALGGNKPRYWAWDVPLHSQAKLSPGDAAVLIVGTQQAPNDADRWEMVELDGYADGDQEVQEFEVGELPAVFDCVDFQGVLGEPARLARDPAMGLGRWLNEDVVRADAEARKILYMQEKDLRPEGPGMSLGVAALLKEKVTGSVQALIVHVDRLQVITEIYCANLQLSAARKERAHRKTRARAQEVAGKHKEAI